MDQQLRLLTGLFEPACQVLYRSSNIIDMPLLQQDTSVAVKVESWAHPFGVSTPPQNRFWLIFLNIKNTKCRKQPFSKSSINTDTWDSFFSVLWQYSSTISRSFMSLGIESARRPRTSRILRAQRPETTTPWLWELPQLLLTGDRRRIWSSCSLRSQPLVEQNLLPTPTGCAWGLPG